MRAAGDPGAAVAQAIPAFDEGSARIVLLDGQFIPGLSRLVPGSVTLQSLSAALDEDGGLISQHLGRHAGWEDEPFSALNTAFIHDGAVIRATGASAGPIHVIHATTGGTTRVSHPRTLFIGSALSQATMVETYVTAGSGGHFTNAVTEILLEDGAALDHYRLLLEDHESFHVGHTVAVQGRDTTFNSLAYAAGAGLARDDVRVLLDAPGSACDLRGLYITSGKQHIDHNVNIDHAKPHATSRLYYKGILDGASRAVFGGTVFVREGADGTDAHQEDKNLLLSHEAEVDSKPALEIYADDVKAGHGATAGAIAEEALFYMQSRGLDERTAMEFLVRGFAGEILDTVVLDPLRAWLEQRTIQALPRFSAVAA
jgi:Fe-S cluster assembly protein SufD